MLRGTFRSLPLPKLKLLLLPLLPPPSLPPPPVLVYSRRTRELVASGKKGTGMANAAEIVGATGPGAGVGPHRISLERGPSTPSPC